MKTLLTIATLSLCALGCRTHHLTQLADGSLEYKGGSLFTTAQAVEISKTSDGFVIKGFQANADAQAMQAVAEGAARGAASGMKP